MVVEEWLTKEERQAVTDSLMRSMVLRGAVNRALLNALRKIEGVDTEVICRRAYPVPEEE